MSEVLRLRKNPAFAIHCFFKGLALLPHKSLRKYLLIPVLINLVLYSSVLGLGYYFVAGWIESLIPTWLSWLEWFLWPVFFLSFFIIGFFSFTMVANIIASPFYSQLANKTIEVLSGKPSGIEEQPVATVVWSEVKRLGYIVTRMLPLLLLFIIPGVNLLAPIIWALFGAWSMSMEYMAYPLENKGLLFKEQKEALKAARLASLSYGGITVLGLSIPVVNLLISPAAVIGAAVYAFESEATSVK